MALRKKFHLVPEEPPPPPPPNPSASTNSHYTDEPMSDLLFKVMIRNAKKKTRRSHR